MKRFRSLILAGISSIWLVTPSLAETDLAACYGETLDVSLRTLVAQDATVLEQTVFMLPDPNAWLVDLGQDGLLHDQPCLVEPIDANGAWGGFIDARLGHADLSIPDIDGVRVRSLRLSGAQSARMAEESEQFWLDILLAEGTEAEDGFIHRAGQNTNPIEGGCLFPEAYLSPVGTRVRMSCATPVCQFDYRIARNLKLGYEIWVDDHTVPLPWIATEKYVRETILSWEKD